MGLKKQLWLEYCAKHNFDVEKLAHKDVDTLVRFLSRSILHCEGYYEDIISVTKQDVFALNSRGRSLFFEMAKVQCSGNNVRKEIPFNYINMIRERYHIEESDVKDNFLSLFVPNSKRTGDVIDLVMKMYPECRTVSKREALEAAAKCHQHSGVMEVLHKHMIFKKEDLLADDWAILSVAMRHENVGAVKWLQKMAACPLDHPLWVQFLHKSNDIGDFYRENFIGYDTTLIKEYLDGDDETKRNCIKTGILEGKNITITWMFLHFTSTRKVVTGQQLLYTIVQRDRVSVLTLETVRQHFPYRGYL